MDVDHIISFQDYKVTNSGFINAIDDAQYFKIGNDDNEIKDAWDEPVPSMTLHPRQVKKLLHGDKYFDCSMKVSSTIDAGERSLKKCSTKAAPAARNSITNLHYVKSLAASSAYTTSPIFEYTIRTIRTKNPELLVFNCTSNPSNQSKIMI